EPRARHTSHSEIGATRKPCANVSERVQIETIAAPVDQNPNRIHTSANASAAAAMCHGRRNAARPSSLPAKSTWLIGSRGMFTVRSRNGEYSRRGGSRSRSAQITDDRRAEAVREADRQPPPQRD